MFVGGEKKKTKKLATKLGNPITEKRYNKMIKKSNIRICKIKDITQRRIWCQNKVNFLCFLQLKKKSLCTRECYPTHTLPPFHHVALPGQEVTTRQAGLNTERPISLFLHSIWPYSLFKDRDYFFCFKRNQN